jgi:ribosomal protein S3
MGQQVNSIIFRLNKILTWESQWFTNFNYNNFIKEDLFIRFFILNFKKSLKIIINSIFILRKYNRIYIFIYCYKQLVKRFNLLHKYLQSLNKKRLKKKKKKLPFKVYYYFIKMFIFKLKKIFFLITKALKKILNCNIFLIFYFFNDIFLSASAFNKFLIKKIKKNLLHSFYSNAKRLFKNLYNCKIFIKNIFICISGCHRKAARSRVTWIYLYPKKNLKLNTIYQKIDYNFTPCILKQGVLGIKTWISFY